MLIKQDAKQLLHECFDGLDGWIELSVGGVHRPNRMLVRTDSIDTIDLDYDRPNMFFGPAVRKDSTPAAGKVNVLRSQMAWVDIDADTLPKPILPPTFIISSGHGWHMYWKLSTPLNSVKLIETLNTVLQDDISADHCFNADRIMRLPGTINAGGTQNRTGDNEPPVPCELVRYVPGNVYHPKQLYIAASLTADVRHRIVSGDRRGYKTRSERDWAIIQRLVAAGMDRATIIKVFETHECGDKYRDPAVDGEKYIDHTIERAKEGASNGRTVVKRGTPDVLLVGDDGYYVMGHGKRRISTFILEPKLLLEGDEGDAILCDVKCAGTDHVWKNEIFEVSSMSNAGMFIRRLTKAAWVWLGRDAETRLLQMHLISQLQQRGVPRAKMVRVIGRHSIEEDERKFFVTDDSTIASDGSVWDFSSAPIVFMDTGRDHPDVLLGDCSVNVEFLRELAQSLPMINDPDVIWPMIGWFMASPMKIAFESYGYRFPILNVFGTRGSGKTTTIIRVFHPLLGYREERTYDANTTRFVMLSLLGSSNAIPIAFSEFRIASVADFARYILLSYDTGRDPRGRPDQTTVDYPLYAPFSIDGEDMVEDPASMERIVAVRMIPKQIESGSQHSASFDRLQTIQLGDFAGPYIQYTLSLDVAMLIDVAEQAVWEVFPEVLPNRVRRNLTVVWAGVLAFHGFMKSHNVWCSPQNGPDVLRSTLNNVYSIKLGRAPTEADSFVEVIVNASARGIRAFPWDFEKDTGVLWFQLMPAFEYYVSQRAHQRRSTLSREAIRTQLMELTGEYATTPGVRNMRGKKLLMYGIELARAAKAGLDVPFGQPGQQITK